MTERADLIDLLVDPELDAQFTDELSKDVLRAVNAIVDEMPSTFSDWVENIDWDGFKCSNAIKAQIARLAVAYIREHNPKTYEVNLRAILERDFALTIKAPDQAKARSIAEAWVRDNELHTDHYATSGYGGVVDADAGDIVEDDWNIISVEEQENAG